MLIEDLAREVHENAVKHGWWETGRNVYEIVALIHSEWSEALEEARAGRPLVWQDESGKPEGIAVELIDGCIRILDYMGYLKVEVQEPDGTSATIEGLYTDKRLSEELEDASVLIAFLHKLTSDAISVYSNLCPDMVSLESAMCLALRWINQKGLDPMKLLLEKHEYNKGRPYKHGKKF